jgi:flagella basal body P-ring formation protein FlgA
VTRRRIEVDQLIAATRFRDDVLIDRTQTVECSSIGHDGN